MGIVEFVLERAKNEGVGIGFEQGKEVGIEITEAKKDADFVKSLLIQTDFSDERIAKVAYVTVAFVEKIKADMHK